MAQSQSRPLWRVAFDSADRVVGPASEQLVRTDTFADLVGMASRMRHVAVKQAQLALRQQWHRMNLPAGTDVRRLSEQVASLERQVRELSRQLEDRDRDRQRDRAAAPAAGAPADGNGAAPGGAAPLAEGGGRRG